MNRTPHDIQSEPRLVALPNDFGSAISFTGTVVAEDVHFNTASGVLTVEKLYGTPNGKTAYGIISASGDCRERRAYMLDDQGEFVHADNGTFALELPVADLHELLAMALQAADADETIGDHMQMLRAANEE